MPQMSSASAKNFRTSYGAKPGITNTALKNKVKNLQHPKKIQKEDWKDG